MELITTDRGFELLQHNVYPPYHEKDGSPKVSRLTQQSSAIGDSCAAAPGSSFLWIGEHHHLNREEVKELVLHLQAWLDTGSLSHS